MRLTVSYYLFLLYSLVLFKPCIPIAIDAFSHAFAEAVHIATVHARYGSNHLEKEVEKMSAENGKNHSAPKTEEKVDVHIPCRESFYLFPVSNRDKRYPALKLYRLEDILISKQAPPPKFSW